MAIFVTGATGFLGRYLARDLLESGEDLVLLVRGKDLEEAQHRGYESLRSVARTEPSALIHRVRICRGSLEEPNLGLGDGDRNLILDSCDQFVHCGASVRFDLPLEEARAINVDGTRAILDLARTRVSRGKQARVDHISTAYVAGRRRGLVHADDLDDSLGHKNTYEATKFEAEQELRAHRAELPVTIYRPSIIVGDSETGWTSNYGMIYWPMKVYAHGLWRICPGRADTPLDIVPVNFVSKAIVELRRQPRTNGGSFHITAGPQGAITLGAITTMLHDFFPQRKPVRLVDPDAWMRWAHPVLTRIGFGRVRRVLRTIAFYVPYFASNPHFDNTETTVWLAQTGLAPPDIEDYLHRLLRFCIDSKWGTGAT